MRLDDRIAIITGGGRGIGRVYATRFLQEGAKVAVADISADMAKETADILSKDRPAIGVRVDVSDPESCEACVAEVVDRFGGVDILVNNAALYGDWDQTDQSLQYLRRMFDVNLHGCWLMAGAVAPKMVDRGGGRIVNQASAAAYMYASTPTAATYDGLPSFSYSQTKWGVVGLTKYLASFLGRWNITVNCIAPGSVATEATLSKIGTDGVARISGLQPIAGTIQAEDLTGAAVFFASDDARFVSGQVLVIDGGRNMPA